MSAPKARRTGPRVTVVEAPASPTGESVPNDVRTRLRNYYKRVKSLSIAAKNAESERKNVQAEAVQYAKEHDLADTPIRFSLDGRIYNGKIIEPQGSDRWDEEKLVDWLHRTGRWEACSTRVLDLTKFEAEVAQGSIPKSLVKKFVVPGKPSTPYCHITEV